MTAGELLAGAQRGDVVAAGESRDYPPLVAVHAGSVEAPWEVTGMTHRLSNGQLLAISPSWQWIANTRVGAEVAS